MKKQPDNISDLDIDKIELKGFSRSVAELEWLLLILVLLYYVAPGTDFYNPTGLFLSIILFALFVISFHYLNFFTLPARWKIALETWIMIVFISWVIWCTGEMDSPLMSLYLLVIITSALTLGKMITFLEVILIASLYLWFSYPVYGEAGLTLDKLTDLMTVFIPVLLVTYVTTMLAADVQYGRQSLKLLSETDELTGIKNKRAFNAQLDLELSSSIRYSRKFSVMMIDADNLKAINDNFGHKAGDQLIKLMSNTISQCLRTSDTVARYGGDEFIVLMPGSEHQSALVVAERIRKALDIGISETSVSRITTTVSIGISSYPKDGADMEALIDRADRALYRSKQAGRNQISVYSSESSPKK